MLVNADTSKYNFFEAMTESSGDGTKRTLQRLGLSKLESHFYYNGRAVSNVLNSSFVPVLLFLDSQGNVTNARGFNSVSDIDKVVSQIEGTISK